MRDADAVAEHRGVLRLRARRHDGVADLADDARLGRILERRREADAVDPHRGAALREAGLAFVPVEADHAGRREILRSASCRASRGLIASGVSVSSLPLLSPSPSSWPSRKLVHTGTLAFFRPRETKPEIPLAGSVSFSAAVTISSHRLRIGDAFLLEQLLVVVEDPVVDELAAACRACRRSGSQN